MKSITVRSSASERFTPDTVTVFVDLSVTGELYDEALDTLHRRADVLRVRFAEAGFEWVAFETLRYGVHPTVEYRRQGKHWDAVRVFRGEQALRLVMPLDRARLGTLLSVSMTDAAEAAVRVEFSLENAEAKRQEVLAGAVRSAQARAFVIATAANATLGELQSAEYGLPRADHNAYDAVPYMAAAAPSAAEPPAPNIEPHDIEVSEEVTLTWALA